MSLHVITWRFWAQLLGTIPMSCIPRLCHLRKHACKVPDQWWCDARPHACSRLRNWSAELWPGKSFMNFYDDFLEKYMNIDIGKKNMKVVETLKLEFSLVFIQQSAQLNQPGTTLYQRICIPSGMNLSQLGQEQKRTVWYKVSVSWYPKNVKDHLKKS